MKYWLPLRADDLSSVFTAAELAEVTRPEWMPYVEDTLADIVAQVREAVASNKANRLAADPLSIPRTLRPAALDIAALRLLKRFALSVKEERKEAAAKAEEKLAAVRRAEVAVLDERGQLPESPALVPQMVAPEPAYGNNGSGWYPTPLHSYAETGPTPMV